MFTGSYTFLIHIYIRLQLGNLIVNRLQLKLYRKLRKIGFGAPNENRTRNLLISGETALTIELPGLRWQREGYDMYSVFLFVSVALYVLKLKIIGNTRNKV